MVFCYGSLSKLITGPGNSEAQRTGLHVLTLLNIPAVVQSRPSFAWTSLNPPAAPQVSALPLSCLTVIIDAATGPSAALSLTCSLSQSSAKEAEVSILRSVPGNKKANEQEDCLPGHLCKHKPSAISLWTKNKLSSFQGCCQVILLQLQGCLEETEWKSVADSHKLSPGPDWGHSL